MFIYLEDLIFHMEGLSNEQVLLDTISGVILANNLIENLDSLRYIPIPVFDDIEIARMYLEQLNDKKLRRQLLSTIQDPCFLHIFHVKINDSGLYNDYISFGKNQKLKFAQSWCDVHNIMSTIKHKPT